MRKNLSRHARNLYSRQGTIAAKWDLRAPRFRIAVMALAIPAYPLVRSPAVRTCASRVESGLFVHGIPRGYKRAVILAGPFALIARDYATQARSTFRPVGGHPGRYYPQKLLVVVRAAATVTVSVPASQRRFALLYGRAHWNIPYSRGYRLADGERKATFHACAANTPSFVPGKHRPVGKWTEFNGSVIVAGVQCVTLDVRTRRRSWKARLSFGAGRCR